MRRLSAVLIAAVILVSFALPAFAIEYDVRKMVVSAETVSLRVGETSQLKVEISPYQADHSVTWVSSDPSVATVSDGFITAVSIGTAEVTVTSVHNPEIFLTVAVLVVVPVESITVEDETVIMPRGAVWEQIAYVMPEDATMQRPVWTTSDRKVAAVDENGVITALKNGYCTITCTAADGFGAKAVTNVQVRAYEGIITEPGEYTVDFEMIEDSGTDEIVKNKKTVKDKWTKTVTFENGCLEKVTDTSVRPVKAGTEVIHLRETHNKKVTKASRHYFFIQKSAVREAGSVPGADSDGTILFRDIPWGVRYKEVKSILSTRKEKLKTPIERNNMLWTQIDGEIAFGDFKAYRNGLSFTSSSANVQNLTANLQKTSFCMGDYYFEKSIPFENLKQNVMKTYSLPENETTSSMTECVWVSGSVTVRLMSKPKYTQLQIAWQGQADETDGAQAETAD